MAGGGGQLVDEDRGGRVLQVVSLQPPANVGVEQDQRAKMAAGRVILQRHQVSHGAGGWRNMADFHRCSGRGDVDEAHSARAVGDADQTVKYC